MNKYKVATLACYVVLIFAIIVAVASVPKAKDDSKANPNVDKKFEEIYVEIQKTGEYMYGLSDTAVRNSHYSKPHTTYHRLCPECADLWGKKKEGIVEVPVDRLKELRSLSSPSQSGQAETDQPVEVLTIEEELDSILLLLKQQQSHLYTNKYTAEIQYHYLKKHKHPKPGIEGGCPECIALRKKQTTKMEFISKQEYERLLETEDRAKEHKNDTQD